jgi:hypothetical protein
MKKQTRIIAIVLLLITSIPVVKTLAFDPTVDDCVTPPWRFWGESIGCGWQASNGHIANELPDGKTCCAIRTHVTYYFGIKFDEQTTCDPIPCPENPNR